MNKLYTFFSNLKNDNQGQDLIEYALMAGFVAVAAGAILPDISGHISRIFTAVNTLLSQAS
jgi:pilus assembly protein Flp/PilA